MPNIRSTDGIEADTVEDRVESVNKVMAELATKMEDAGVSPDVKNFVSTHFGAVISDLIRIESDEESFQVLVNLTSNAVLNTAYRHIEDPNDKDQHLAFAVVFVEHLVASLRNNIDHKFAH